MTVYLDKTRNRFRGLVCCHMIADTLPELHAMAERIGMRREWFQPLSSPHYDVSLSRKRAAIAAGACVVDRWEFVTVLRRLRNEGAG